MLALLLAAALQDATVVARDAIQPHLAVDADGAAYVAFIRDGQIQLAVSADQGKSFSAPVVAIDAGGKARGGMQRGPRVAVDGKKTVYVTAPLTFDEAELKKQYPTQDLYLAVSTDGGKTFSKPAMVNDVPKKAPESLHWLAASPGEGAFVAWLDLRQRQKGGQDLFVAKIADQGRKISRNLPVAMTLCECCAPGLAIDGKGNPSLVFREGSTTSRGVFLVQSTNGGASFGKPVRLNQGETKIDTCPMDAPAVAVSPDGKAMAVAWMDMRSGQNNRDVHWVFGTSGRFVPEVTVNDDKAGQQGHASLAVAKDGTVWCAWEDARGGPNAQRVYVADAKSRKNVALSAAAEGKAGYPSLAAGPGWMGVAYEAGGSIAFRLVTDPILLKATGPRGE